LLFIGGLIAGSLWILRPFLPAVIWATMIAVATWPLLLRVQGSCGDGAGSRLS
jgi:predicted PurR-regulated permease PerM